MEERIYRPYVVPGDFGAVSIQQFHARNALRAHNDAQTQRTSSEVYLSI